ncbi:hypothetical protein ACLOJK_033305 [Asimina triloba]
MLDTPMDYNDSDFPSQNFQLGGEDSNKFPPGFRSYALPKFDLDESLQVHLRYDTLVETDILLGIQNQEENRWIDEFSRENSGIEFNSSAAESCSIPRRNNVWSEATSTESVEMLLKSVGQDEILTKQTVIVESTFSDGLCNINNQVDTNLNQDDCTAPKVGDMKDSNATLHPDRSLENISDFIMDAAQDLLHIEAPAQKDRESGYESLMDLDLCPVEEKYGSDMISAAEQVGLDPKGAPSSTGNNSQETDHVSAASGLDAKSPNVIFESIQVDSLDTSLQNVIVDDTDGCREDLCYDEHRVLLQDGAGEAVIQVSRKNSLVKDQQDEALVLRNCSDEVGILSDSTLNSESSVQIREELNKGFSSKADIHQMESVVFSKEHEIGGHFSSTLQEASFISTETDKNAESTSCGSSKDVLGNPCIPLVKINSSAQIMEGYSDALVYEKSKNFNKGFSSKADIHQMESVVFSKEHEIGGHFSSTLQEASFISKETDNNAESTSCGSSKDILGNPCIPLVKINSSAQIMEGYSDALVYEKSKNLSKDDNCGDGVNSFRDVEIDFQLRESNQETTLAVAEETNNSPENRSGGCNNDSAKIPNSVVFSAFSTIHQTQETIEANDGNDSLGVHGALITVQDPELELAEKDCNNPEAILPDQTNNKTILPGKDSKEQQIPDCQSAKFSSSLDCGLSGDDHTVRSDDPNPVKQIASLLTDSENIETKIGDPSLSQKIDEGSFHGQNATMGTDKITSNMQISESKCTVGAESVPTEDIILLKSSNNLDAHALSAADVPDDKMEQKGEILTVVSMEPCCLVPKVSCKSETASERLAAAVSGQHKDDNSEAVSPTHPTADSGKHTDDNSEAVLPMVITQTSSAENSFYSVQENQPEAPKATEPTEEHKDLEQDTPYASAVKIKDESELVGNSSRECKATASKATGETASNTEMLSESIPSPVDGSPDGSGQDKQHQDVVNLASGEASEGGQTTGDVPYGVEQSSSKLRTLSGVVETGNDSPSAGEAKCDSPIVISCSVTVQSDACQDGGDNSSLYQNDTVSDNLPCTPSNINKHSDNVHSAGHDLGETNVSEGDTGFTFMIGSLKKVSETERETGQGWKPFSNTQTFDIPQTREESPATPGLSQTSSVILQECTPGSHKVSDEQKVRRGAKSRSKDKTRVMQDVVTEKESASGGRPAKEISRSKQAVEKDGTQSSASVYSNGTANKAIQVQEKRQYSHMLPLLGTAPDEACMISAFGDANRGADDGRSMWEDIWRVSVEKYRSQKSPLSNLESPLPLRSGARAPEQASRSSTLQNKAPISTPTSRPASKASPPATLSPTASLSSSVWSFSTLPRDPLPSSGMPRSPVLDSHASISSLHPYQSPHARPYVRGSAAWLPQVSPGSVPWAVTPRPPVVVGPHYSALPIAEAVQVSSAREQPAPHTPSMQLGSPIPLPPFGPGNVSAGTAGQSESTKTNIMTTKVASADQKPRKRKKGSLTPDRGQISAVTLAQTDPVSATSITKHVITSVGIQSPVQPSSIVTTSAPVSTPTLGISSTHNQIVGSGSKRGPKVYMSEETSSNIEQSKLHAADAAALAAAAVKHSEAIWNQLAIHKDSGLVPDVEAKLASAAAAVAAAVSVAKAAAAAAKVASDAALQAKLMADEALSVLPLENPSMGSEIAYLDSGKNLEKSTTTLKGKEKTTSSDSIIVATREAARKRVEATSAAARRAENLDAVVKAAELAADAVSQAGTVISMGDPIPLTLNELVEAGPMGYWKAQKFSFGQSIKSNNIHGGEELDKNSTDKGLDKSVIHPLGKASNRKETMQSRDEEDAPSEELFRPSEENEARMVNGAHQDSVKRERSLGVQKSHKISDHSENVDVDPNLEVVSRAASVYVQNDDGEKHQKLQTSKENSIKEGSDVEVVRDDYSCRGVWFSAKVLSLKDGKAHVCYHKLLLDDGQTHLEEWIPLEGEADMAPRIRIPHPISAVKFEGSRKRRRAAVGNYMWSVGDRVDTLTNDGWREGIVTEIGNEDKTKLTVHFPAKSEMANVRAWNLRPSLIWKDDQWMEWSRESNASPHEVDTPQEKRQKLGRLEVVIGPQIEAGGKDTFSVGPIPTASRKCEESRQLPFTAKDKTFTVGRNIREENNANSLKTKRIGLQMEGSKVIFGVPKPGKKRKFMDVSKHYNEDKSAKIAEGTDSAKIAKYLVPQGTLGWKNSSNLDNNRGKQEQGEGLKPKASKPGKARSTSNRGLSLKNSLVVSAASAAGNDATQDQLMNAQALNSHERGCLEVLNPRAGEGSQLFPSAPLSDVPSSKKCSSGSEGEGRARRKFAPGSKPVRDDDKGSNHNENTEKPIPDASEPRRSNRRIQPTSRIACAVSTALVTSCNQERSCLCALDQHVLAWSCLLYLDCSSGRPTMRALRQSQRLAGCAT